MKYVISLTLLLLLFGLTYGQNINERYEGVVSREGSIQLVYLDFYFEDGIQKATYEIPEIGSYDIPVEGLYFKNDTLSLKIYYGNFFCFIDSSTKQISGISEKWNPKIRLHLKSSGTGMKEKPYTKEEITFYNNDITLAGMIFKPRNNLGQKTKYVILVHGSGAQDRYSPYYISLGHILSKNGIGVLLFDKRGTGSSEGDFEVATFDDLANDAIAALDYLESRTDLNISKIGLLGTSQGGWIAPIACNKSKNCDFLILNVGPSVSVFEQDIHRVKYSMKADGWDKEVIDSAVTYTKAYFQYARSNKERDWNLLKNYISLIQNSEWAGYLNFPENQNDFVWWRNNNYEPKEDLQKLNCPVLSLFGEKDNLVPPEENEDKMRAYLTATGVDFEIKIVPGVAHDMRTFQGLNGYNWDWPKVYWQWRTQPKAFIEHIVSFIKQQ